MNRLFNSRRVLIIASQICLFTLSYYGSFLLRFDFRPNIDYQLLFVRTLPVVVAVELLVFYAFGLLRGWWRYSGMSDAQDICEASFTAAVVLFLMIDLVINVDGYPRSVLSINLALTMLLVG